MNHNRHHHFDQTNDDVSLYRQALEVKNEEDLCYNNGLSGGPSLFHDAIESSRSFLDIRLSRPLTDTNPSFKPCFKALNLKEHQMASMLGQLATSSPQLGEVFGSWSCGRVLGGYQAVGEGLMWPWRVRWVLWLEQGIHVCGHALWACDRSAQRKKGAVGGSLWRKGGNGTSCTHSATKSCVFGRQLLADLSL
ncbi:unnamed protein product [Brassica oleracea]